MVHSSTLTNRYKFLGRFWTCFRPVVANFALPFSSGSDADRDDAVDASGSEVVPVR